MTWNEFCELRAPIMSRMRSAKSELNDLESVYIDEHKTFNKGEHVVVRLKKMSKHAVVYDNKIVGNGRVIPVLLLLRKNRTSRPNFFHMHETDENIVIERFEE